MKTAILILAHKDPPQLARLCGVLSHPDTTVFVHLDAKAEIAGFSMACEAGAVFIRDRVKVRWAGFSMIEATLNSLREIEASGTRYDYLHLISGQDYPVMPAEKIHRELESSDGKNFIAYRPVNENDPADRMTVNRYRAYHVETSNRLIRGVVKNVNKLFRIRRTPPLYPVYKGSQWFTLTRESIRYILRFCDENPAYTRFFRRTACPDEMFFQNILIHSPLSATLLNDNKRYIKWVQGSPNPEMLTKADLPDIESSGAWFARKFEGMDAVLDMLDDVSR